MRFVVFFITVLFLPLQFLSQIEKKSLLWEVKNAEGKTCSYLFGTIHAIDESKFFYPKKLEKIVSKCDAICLEIAGISTNAPSVDKLMMSEKSINQLFSISQMDSIHQWAEQFLLMKPEQFDQNFDRAKPFLLMQFILKSSLPEKTKSYEIQFEEIAKMNKKELLGLETVDFQLSLFDNMSVDNQVKMVMETLREGENSQKKFEEMEQIYLDQDLDRLYRLTKDDSNYLNRSFLEDRNLDWIPKFTSMMKDKVVFIAVGAAHLAGPEGVIELFIKEGFQLTPIKL